MKMNNSSPTPLDSKKPYVAPQLDHIQIDTEIALVMDSNNQNQGPPAELIPPGLIQKIFKFGA
ncbi:MAG: hypothetical protein RIR94_1810 [Bacteroidota bacterium]|jgi:hypothetical protein